MCRKYQNLSHAAIEAFCSMPPADKTCRGPDFNNLDNVTIGSYAPQYLLYLDCLPSGNS